MKTFFLIGLLFISGFSKAHLRSRSSSEWNFEGNKVKVFFTVSARFVTKIPLIDPLEKSVGQQLSAHLRNNIWLKRGDNICSLSELPLSFPLEGVSFYSTFTFFCPKNSKNFSIFFNAFFNISPTHLHFADINNEQVLFSKTKREWKTGVKEPVEMNFLKKGKIIALFIGLIFLGRSLKVTLLMVIVFIGGYFIPFTGVEKSLVETFMSLIIILVFAENIRERKNLNPLIYQAFAFFLLCLPLGVSGYPLLLFGGMALFTSCYGFLKKENPSWIILGFLFGLIYGLV
ncbi:MAG: hypothetical protein VYD54_12230 [Bdellovibrionota bacterium]|nr:hypothetical protein [Bdellovibrionota bacterium]